MGGAVSSVFGGGDSGPSAGELIAQQQAQQVGAIGPGGTALFGTGPGGGRVVRTRFGGPAQQLADILGPAAVGIAGQLGDPTALQQSFLRQRLAVLTPELERQEAQLRERLAQTGNPLATSGVESPGAAAALERFGRQRRQQEQALAEQAVTQGAQLPLQQLAQITALQPQLFQAPQVGAQTVDVTAAQAQEAAQRQAEQQQQSQLLGSLVGLGSAFALACWVAEELYGDDVKTWTIRDWVLRNDNAFTRLYRRHGETWARWVRSNRLARAVARFVWDRLYVRARRG